MLGFLIQAHSTSIIATYEVLKLHLEMRSYYQNEGVVAKSINVIKYTLWGDSKDSKRLKLH